jgi:hypothetical protein
MQLKNRRGQFSVIAAFLVVLVLITAINISYTRIQSNMSAEPVSILNPTQRISKAIDNILAFSVSYYASIVNVTGDYMYAQNATTDYLIGGFNKLAHSEADANPTFNLESLNSSDPADVPFKVKWYKKQSSSNGTLSLTYDLPSIGLYGVRYNYQASLRVNALKMESGRLSLKVYSDEVADLSLTEDSFRFLQYNSTLKKWISIYPTSVEILSDGTYSISLPPTANENLCFVEVRDNRGIIVRGAYLKDVNTDGDNLDFTRYTINLDWNDIAYPDTMVNDYVALEYLQNGTVRYLGQSLNSGDERPIPEIPVRLLRVNQTINSINRECRFQVEDWDANFRVPLGITSNNTLFSGDNMIVFLVNHNVSAVTVWWTDDDSAKQTPLAIDNVYFSDDIGNSKLESNVRGHPFVLDFKQWNAPSYYFTSDYDNGKVIVKSYLGYTNSSAPVFPAEMTYVVYNGIVRDIVSQTAVVDTTDGSMPTIYYNFVITLPANCTYYTYQITNTMLETTQARRIDDLSLIKLRITDDAEKYVMTEFDNEIMEVVSPTSYPSQYKGANRWIEYLTFSKDMYTGAGIMMMQESVDEVFKFDRDISPLTTGRFNVLNSDLLVSPVLLIPLTNYQQYSQVTWHGAVTLFYTESLDDTIYYKDGSNNVHGLYALVVYPPTVS